MIQRLVTQDDGEPLCGLRPIAEVEVGLRQYRDSLEPAGIPFQRQFEVAFFRRVIAFRMVTRTNVIGVEVIGGRSHDLVDHFPGHIVIAQRCMNICSGIQRRQVISFVRGQRFGQKDGVVSPAHGDQELAFHHGDRTILRERCDVIVRSGESLLFTLRAVEVPCELDVRPPEKARFDRQRGAKFLAVKILVTGAFRQRPLCGQCQCTVRGECHGPGEVRSCQIDPVCPGKRYGAKGQGTRFVF